MVVQATQISGLVPYAVDAPTQRIYKINAEVAYAPAEARATNVSNLYAEVPYALDTHAQPFVSDLYAQITYTSGLPDSARSRAWSFVLDGHTFYVLDLGTEGTFLYDIDTQQWCQFKTDGHNGWNLKNGIRWGTVGRVLGGDEAGGYVWELDPNLTTDEGFRDITHMATGSITTRSRVFHAVESVRIAGSLGNNDDISSSSFSLSFSDDGGNTFVGPFIVETTQGDFDGEIAFTSLGSFMAPGRIFQFSDIGGLQRIDGADVFIEDFDDNQLITKTQAELTKRSLSRGQ